MTEARSNRGLFLALGVIAALAFAAGYWAYGVAQQQSEPTLTLAPGPGVSARPAIDRGLIGQDRPAFSLADLEGVEQHVSQWDGKVLLINFWATWCPPCRKEMPAFVELHEQYGGQGFEIVGIAIDDAVAVRDFIDTLGVDYPILIGELDASEVSRLYGNHLGALPYSVLVDRASKIRFIQPGELTHDVLERELRALL
jgi:thiol-disulfide isomerase/thioredoxin